MEALIRRMASLDAPAVDRIAAEAYGAGFEDPAAFAAKVAAGIGLVAVVGTEIAGYGVALPWHGALPELQARPGGPVDHPEYLHVHDICVAAAHRGAGIGPALMTAFDAVAGELGLTTMSCVAVHGAEVVWARLGWTTSGHAVPADYPSGSVAMTRFADASVRFT
ncbi:MAG: GNAT family N-acetyltransferase [Ilumatobacteraceae bacterium]